MINILKGMLIGVGKIIPGVSGSMIAISLGVYEKCIDIISNLFTEFKYNYKFIFNLCLGFLISVIFFSKIIYYFIMNYYFVTMCFFIGLIIGTIPNILKNNKINSKIDYIYFIIPFIILFIISILGKNEIVVKDNIIGYLITIMIGFIDALTMIIPGISGTAIFVVIGVYEFVLILFSEFLFPFIIFFVIGLIIGILITSKVINYYFKNYNRETYLLITGFVLSSVFFLIKDVFVNFNIIDLIIGILLLIIGYLISYFFDNK